MDEDDYKGYITRAQFFNASGRTLDGLCGMIGRKPVMYTVPKGMEEYLDNVDGKGHSLNQFVNSCCKDFMITNWGGVLVDMPSSENVVSQKDFEDNEMYAYMTYYRAESIINWRWTVTGRRQSLKYLIFKEKVDVETSTYTTEEKYYYRVCEIDDTGYYKQTLYNDNNEILSQVYPSSKKGKFRFIPFYFLSVAEEPSEPLLNDLVNVNLSHYRKSADQENGAHWTGVPTPWAQGVEPQVEVIDGEEVAKPLKLGGARVLFMPMGASLNYLEFGGQGCQTLRQMMIDDEDRMAILGARIISQEKKGVEAAETAKIHRAGENSVLAEIAVNLSEVFKKLLKIYLEWSTGSEIADDELDVSLNTDYDVATMSSSEITALVSLWQQGGIAKRDLFDNLKEGEIIAANRDFDEMNSEIDEEQQARMAPMPVEE